jgi:integrase
MACGVVLVYRRAYRRGIPTMKLTPAYVRAYRGPDKDVVDDALPGFHIRFRASGAHVYAVRYGARDKRSWRTIGPAAVLTLQQARAAAKAFQVKLAQGCDPVAEKTKAKIEAAQTFGALIGPYLARQRHDVRASTVAEIERYLNNHARPLHKLPVREIDRATVAALLADVEAERGPGARNNARNYVSGFFGWMRGEGFVDVNPVVATNKAASKSRDRLLADSEVRTILAALDSPQRVDADFSDIVRLLFLTGLRRDEIAKLEWDEVYLDDATIIVSSVRMKNHKDHLVPLSTPALALLRERHARLVSGDSRVTVFGRRDTGFSGFSKAKRELDDAIAATNGGEPVALWALHDIRRYVSTTLNERLGVEPHIAEVVLAHYPKGVSGVYNRGQYAGAKRRALDKLAAHLDALATGAAPEAKVVAIGRRMQ